MRIRQHTALLLLMAFIGGCGGPPSVLRSDGNPDPATIPVQPGVVSQTSGIATDRGESAVVFVEFIATPQDVVDKMLKLAQVTRDDVVYDLGCGDGRIVVTAARRYGCRAVGCDLDRLRVQEAKANAQANGVAHRVSIIRSDVLAVDLHEATVVALYLGTRLNARLIPQLKTLRPGARIVSHEFGIGDIPPDKTVVLTSDVDGQEHTVHLWTCPLRSAKP